MVWCFGDMHFESDDQCYFVLLKAQVPFNAKKRRCLSSSLELINSKAVIFLNN